MTGRDPRECEDVLIAVMAGLDGETPALSPAQIEAHLGGCADCRAALAPMTVLQRQLAGLALSGPATDLWPAVGRRIGADRSVRQAPWALALVAGICVAWRAGQLVFDLPLPVVNTAVPLTLSVLLARWLVGDLLTIDETTPDFRQERA